MPERARPLLRAMIVKAGTDYVAAPLNDPPVASIATPYRLFPSVSGSRNSNEPGRCLHKRLTSNVSAGFGPV